MPHNFVHQPYEGGYDLRDFFEEVAADPFYKEVEIVVAWAKRSGVDALRSSIETLKSRGAHLRVIVGISQGGTSQQGLKELAALTDEMFVFHVPDRTFHPKLYFATGPDRAISLTGSHNLTAGGAARNFEAGTLSRLNLLDVEDAAYAQSLRSYIDKLIEDDQVCKKVDYDFLSSLVGSSRYPLSDEDDPGVARSEPSEDGGNGAAGEGQGDPALTLFGRTKNRLRNILRSKTRSSPPRAGASPQPGKRSAPSTPSAVGGRPTVTKRWFKKLRSIDAQHPGSQDGHFSNTMTLVADRRHPIATQTYFRETFFGDETWANTTSRGQKLREVATIQCEVIARGSRLGEYNFVVRHTPAYDSNQNNRATELVWGDLGKYMQGTSHVGDFATLEKLSNGTYRLHLEPAPAGAFVE